MNWTNKNAGRQAFTITEIIAVVVIFAVIAAFGMSGYRKTVNKSRERAAILALTGLHSANEIYTSKYGEYVDGAGLTEVDLRAQQDDTPAGLDININPVGMAYSYTRSAVDAYTATADWAGSGAFTARVDESAISAANPCCSAGACPTLPAC